MCECYVMYDFAWMKCLCIRFTFMVFSFWVLYFDFRTKHFLYLPPHKSVFTFISWGHFKLTISPHKSFWLYRIKASPYKNFFELHRTRALLSTVQGLFYFLPHKGFKLLPHKSFKILPHRGFKILPHKGFKILPHKGFQILPHKGFQTLSHKGFNSTTQGFSNFTT